MEKTKNTNDHDYALTHVHEKEKKGFFSMFVVMLGFTFFSASMLTGGNLGTGLPLKDFFIAVLIGNFILACYTELKVDFQCIFLQDIPLVKKDHILHLL